MDALIIATFILTVANTVMLAHVIEWFYAEDDEEDNND